MMRLAVAFVVLLCCAGGALAPRGRAQQGVTPAPPAAERPQPAAQFEQWADEFDGAALDEAKWERFTFEGGSGGKLEVKEGRLRLRSASDTRAGVRSKPTFVGDRFSVEARVAKVGQQLLAPGDKASTRGFATLTLLFDGSGRNRIEWMFTSEGTLEAWSVVDGTGERLDNRKLGLKFDRPVLAIIRRGDEFLFVVNKSDAPAEEAQVALTKTIKNLPRSFRVMLYGFGSSENEWESVRVVTAK